MNKKRIIITGAAGLLSFAGAFAYSWLLSAKGPKGGEGAAASAQVRKAGEEIPRPVLPEVQAPGIGPGGEQITKALTEKQLKNLAYELQQKMQEYNSKLQELEVREQRLQRAEDTVRKEVENLDKLRVELATIVAHLKEEQGRLHKSRLEIAQAEKTNLISVASAYDKMDASSAGKILTNMCTGEGTSAQKRVFGGKGSNMDDAVKILHYMSERTKAKLLAELANSEPKLAAVLCQRLKEIAEGE